jgi:chemotaxis protein CheD
MNDPIRRTETELVQVGSYYDGSKRYYDQVSEVTVVKLFSGDCYTSEKSGEMIMTILGSCISTCIRDPILRIGGMNHFLLPGNNEGSTIDKMSESARYGVFAMEKLINSLLKLGAIKSRLEVKAFGGGNVSNSTQLIGSKNVAFIKEFIKNEGLNLVAEHLGGTSPRRIHYYPDSGKVMMRELRRQDDLKIIDKELEFQKTLSKQAKIDNSGDVELF